MSKEYDNLIAAMKKYTDTKEGFGILHVVTNNSNGHVFIGFPDDAPFYIDADQKIHIKSIDHYATELDRLNAITKHQEELSNIMANQCRIYDTLVNLLETYDKVLGTCYFNIDTIDKSVH